MSHGRPPADSYSGYRRRRDEIPSEELRGPFGFPRNGLALGRFGRAHGGRGADGAPLGASVRRGGACGLRRVGLRSPRSVGAGGPSARSIIDLAFAFVAGGALDRVGEAGRHGARNGEAGLARGDADRADLGPGDVAAAAQQGQQPARIGIVAAADVHLEPDDILEAGAVAIGLARRAVADVDQILGHRQPRAMHADQGGGDILGRLLGEQARAQGAILLVDLDRLEQGRRAAAHDRRRGSPRQSARAAIRRRSARRAASSRRGGGADKGRSGPRCPSCRRGRCGPSGAAASRRRAEPRHG